MKFTFGLQHPLTCKPWTTLSNPCNKVRGEYFSKEVFLRLYYCVCYHCVGMYPAYICIFLHESADEYTTPSSPSFLLSLFPSGSRLPSFLPSLSCNTFIGQMHSEHNFRSAVTVRICIFVSSRKNLHTCKLPLAGSRFPLVKYARGSHIGFLSRSQTRSCALRMPRYVTFTEYSLINIRECVCVCVWLIRISWCVCMLFRNEE